MDYLSLCVPLFLLLSLLPFLWQAGEDEQRKEVKGILVWTFFWGSGRESYQEKGKDCYQDCLLLSLNFNYLSLFLSFRLKCKLHESRAFAILFTALFFDLKYSLIKRCSINLCWVISYISLLCWLSGKESACNVGDAGSISGLERSPGEGYGNPL